MAKMMRILAVAVGEKNDRMIRSDSRLSGLRPYIRGLIEGLKKSKRRIGRDFEIEYRHVLPYDLATESAAIEALKPKRGSEIDLIFAMSTTVVLACHCIRSIPVVFPSVSDFKADKINLNGNTTGVSARRSQTAGECFVHFFGTVPTLEEVYVLHKEAYPPSDRALRLVKKEARKRRVKVTPVDIQSVQDVRTKLSALPKRDLKAVPVAGILVLPVDICLGAASTIIEIGQGNKNLPTFFPITDFVNSRDSSALGGYGVPQHKCGELAAQYVERILWGGTKPTALKVTEADDDAFEWMVSSAAAEALNIKLAHTV